MPKTYLTKNVLEAAVERIRLVFDRFETVCVSYSGGKDSTVLLELARREARRRGRQIHVLFIDLEAQYRLTIEQVEDTMLGDDILIPWWICLPFNLRNAVSVFQPHWACWDPGQVWFRDLPPHSCVVNDTGRFPFFRYRMEFEEFIVKFPDWLAEGKPFASLVAIRSDESLNRYRAVAERMDGKQKKSAYQDGGRLIRWGTVMDLKTPHIVSFYPIYDWRIEDVWKYIGETGIRYNAIYDRMYLAGVPLSEQRICQPYGDDQRRGLDLWQQCEPETWAAVLDRVVGVNYGARYAGDKMLGYRRGLGLPEGHTWRSYTFFLLSTVPDVMRERYLSNYAVFLEWWMRKGYPQLAAVHDDETELLKTSSRRRLPSWRRLALAVLKNDFLCKSLSIGQIKDVYSDVYERVEAGEPVKVRKSVRPVYEYLRQEYDRYKAGGVDAVKLELTVKDRSVKDKYRDL